MLDQPSNTLTLPPFLFRAASIASRGLNTPILIDPLHMLNKEYHLDLQDLEHDPLFAPRFRLARSMLRNHLDWKYEVASEFSSWSVSILYVLVHAVRKANFLNEKGVILYVLDTSRISPSRVHSARKLLIKYGMESFPKLMEQARGKIVRRRDVPKTMARLRADRLRRILDSRPTGQQRQLWQREVADCTFGHAHRY